MRSIALIALIPLGSLLAADADNDGVTDREDCRPNDASLWSIPAEGVSDLALDRVGATGLLSWSTPGDIGGTSGSERYDAFGAHRPDTFGHPGGFCIELDGNDLTASDASAVAAGDVVHYLVRVENDCGSAPVDSDPPPVAPRSLNYLVASNTNDSGPGSLREAVDLASGGDAICVTATGNLTLASQLQILDDISILGPGADLLTIDPGSIALWVSSSSHISGVTFEGSGLAAIRTTSFLDPVTIASSTIRGFTEGVRVIGGALTISDSLITECATAVQPNPGSNHLLTITNTTISSNTLGIRQYYSNTYVDSSTFSGNDVAIQLGGYSRLTLTSSTISGNDTGIEAYYDYEDRVTLRSSTISGNTVGLYQRDNYYAYEWKLENTILSNSVNCLTDDEPFTFTSQGHNLSSDTTCPPLTQTGDQNNVDPMLGPLADNGGPTETQSPLAGSPVIDAGRCPGQTLDQRGLPRPVDDPGAVNADDGCDVGAVERQ